MAALVDKLNRIAPWRFLIFFSLLAIVTALAGQGFDWRRSLLIGFDVAATVFLLSCIAFYFREPAQLRRVAAANDANRAMLLVIIFVLTLTIFAALFYELGQRSGLAGHEKLLIAATLILVWFFGNMVYALHYAHLFYMPDDSGKDGGGLNFPGTPHPRFSDFTYFAFTLGVAVQTSDVEITSRHLRVVATCHCVAGFFFNLGVLALTINILGSS